MNRRHFIKNGCFACLGLMLTPGLLTGCRPLKQVSGRLDADGVSVSIADFISRKGGSDHFLPYLVIRNDALLYPICVYRISDVVYTALYMRCSHQGAELQVAGDRLTCPAHGSEFDQQGASRQGPASIPLRSFPTIIRAQELFIDLRKVT